MCSSFGSLLGFFVLSSPAFSQSLEIRPVAGEVGLEWQHTFPPDAGVPTWKEFRVLSSNNLSNWTERAMLRVDQSEGNVLSSLRIPRNARSGFFRLEEHLVYGHRSNDAAPPAIYERQYLNAWQTDLTRDDFVARTTTPGELEAIPWDPTTASFFAEYQTAPADHNADLAPDDPERRMYDFTLNEAELALFQRNGFVVSPRVKASFYNEGNPELPQVPPTPTDLYYAVWTDDLPVFITADSVLDAWHQTFASMLEELDEIAIHPLVKRLVKEDWPGAFAATQATWPEEEASAEENALFQQAVDDVTLYMDLARAFLDTTPPTSSPTALDWYEDLIDPDPNQVTKRGLYGDMARLSRPNLYKPRGRYTRSGVLSAHFRTIVWLSRAQFHIAHSSEDDQRDRELRAATLLALTLKNGNLADDWRNIEMMLQGMAGQSDAMTVPEMIALLESLSLDSLSTLTSPTALASVRDALLSSNYGLQEVNGGYFDGEYILGPDEDPCNPIGIEQARALSLFGQRWTPDAWNFQKVVFPEVRQSGVAVPRRLPSGIDVAYATLGNEAAASILVERMQDPDGVPFRDGYDLHQNLTAVRNTFDSQQEAFWTEHLYGRWLHALRSLSEPLEGSAPDTFRTSAWRKRILNTQLASWTQLRHDTLLYAKQSFTPPLLCEFPDGYVEPYPEMWQRLSDIALAYHGYLSTLNLEGPFGVEVADFFSESPAPLPTDVFSPEFGYAPDDFPDRTRQIDRAERLTTMKNHLENFSEKCLLLKSIAERQLAGLPHTEEIRTFIEATVEDFANGGYGSARLYSGWFPNLYFENLRHDSLGDHPSALWNPVVVDVHTDAEDTICYGDPGAILNEGTGKTQFMLLAVKHSDGSTCTYAGPVMSHYEFTTPLGVRLSDEEWKTELEGGNEPRFAGWKHDYLVPVENE